MCKRNGFKKPVVNRNCVSIGCGMLKSAVVVIPSGPGNEYVELKKMTPWLCAAVAGVTYSKAPLRRTRLLDDLKLHLKIASDKPALAAIPAVLDKMQKLFDKAPALAAIDKPGAAIDEPVHSPVKIAQTGHGPTRPKKGIPDFVKTVQLPNPFGGTGMCRWRLWHKGNSDSVCLHIDDLPMAIEYLHEEVEHQGVPPLEEVVDDEDVGGSISWDRRDFSWQVRIRSGMSGLIHRKNFGVAMKSSPSGDRLTPQEFSAAKEEARKEATMWLTDNDAQ